MQQLGNIISISESAIPRYSGQPTAKPLVVLLRGIITPNVLTPRYGIRTGFELLLRASAVLQNLPSSLGGRVRWTEFRNKLQCFYLFAHVDSALDLGSKSIFSLPDLTARANRLDTYFSVFASEGAGHYYTDWYLANRSTPRSLLTDQAHTQLPVKALVPLHAGMGLSLAEAVLRAFEHNAFPDFDSAINKFIELCEDNSIRGYVGATYEALGLATRNLFPHLISALNACLARKDGKLLEYFWHGVGRAVYFSPINFLPCGDGTLRGLQMCQQEPPHNMARRNAVAGFSWALTLVNIRQPEVIADFLLSHEKHIIENDAFINGICSALIVWLDSTASSSDLEELAGFVRVGRGIDTWNRYVVQSCNKARQYYETLRLTKSIGEVFHCQDIGGLVQMIESMQERIE